MRFEADDFQGLTPAVDPRRSDKLYMLNGKNYVLDSFGPRSVFGDRYLTPYPLGRPEWVEGMRLHLRTGDRVFHFTSDSIIEWSESHGGWRVLYSFPSTQEHPYRWSGDYLNGIMFFCHPSVGILAYQVDQDICLPLEGPGVPSQPIALCVCSGRIAIIDEKLLTWSAPGDGTDYIPQLGGAGFQAINDRVPGYPIMLNSYARGLLVWTTGGVMRSEFTADAAVFRHRALVTEYRPINSFCTFRLDNDTIGFLDARGIFQSQGETPTPLTPLFNEFLIDYVKRNKLTLTNNNVRLEFDDLNRRLYLSVSVSETNPLFERAFVLYTPLDKWGTFDEAHYGIHPILIQDSSRAGPYFGYTDSTARVRYWDEGGSRETLPESNLLNSYYPLIEQPVTQELGGEAVILAASMSLNTMPTTPYTQRAGYYDVGTSPSTSNVTGLNSRVQLGYLRARGDSFYDQLVEISQIYVGSIQANPYLIPVSDFNLVPEGVDDEDYEAGTGGEDFGIEDVTYVNHGLRVISTLDGRSAWNETVPDLIRFNRASREYSCGIVGLFNIIELSAIEVGEAYHVRALEVTALDAGRLN